MQTGLDDEVSHVEIKEMFRVYESREGIPEEELDIITSKHTAEEVCVTAVTYHGLVGTLVILFLLLLVLAVAAGIGFKRARMIGMKNQLADANSLSSTAYLAEPRWHPCHPLPTSPGPRRCCRHWLQASPHDRHEEPARGCQQPVFHCLPG